MHRARAAALVLLSVLLGGTFGYMLIERWSVLDSLYMTVITVATVGYGEVHPLSPAGEWFTIALVFMGVGGIAYSIATLFEFMLEGHFLELVEGRRMAKRISELDRHYIVIGMGRVGSVVCATLEEQGVPFVVIDRCDDCVQAAGERGWLYLQGDATLEETLETAGIRRARGLVTALDTDADNLFVSVTARDLNPDLYIVSRSTSQAAESKILRSGADRVVTPNVIGGRRMATSLLNPVVADYLDVVTRSADLEYRLEGLTVRDDSRGAGRRLGESHEWNDSGAFIIAVSSTGEIDSAPSPERVLRSGDQIVAFGTDGQLAELAKII